MKHIKNLLSETNTHSVDIVIILIDNEFITSKTNGAETIDELKTIHKNLDSGGYIHEHKGFMRMDIVEGDYPHLDIYFRYEDEEIDVDNTPIYMVDEETLDRLLN